MYLFWFSKQKLTIPSPISALVATSQHDDYPRMLTSAHIVLLLLLLLVGRAHSDLKELTQRMRRYPVVMGWGFSFKAPLVKYKLDIANHAYVLQQWDVYGPKCCAPAKAGHTSSRKSTSLLFLTCYTSSDSGPAAT